MYLAEVTPARSLRANGIFLTITCSLRAQLIINVVSRGPPRCIRRTIFLFLSFFPSFSLRHDIFPTTSSTISLRNFHPREGAYRDEDNGGKRGDDNIVSRNSEIFCHVLVREGTTRLHRECT